MTPKPWKPKKLTQAEILAALKRGEKDAEALLEATRGMFGEDPSRDTLVLR